MDDILNSLIDDSLMKVLFMCVLIVHSLSAQAVSKQRFQEILEIFSHTFSSYASRDGREFEILASYEADWAQAFARRWERDQLIVYGGIARIKGVSEDSFALGLCHEIGHLYAGIPYSDAFNRLSAEGQADYWATQTCWSEVAPLIGSGELTQRAEAAALILTAFFASNRHLPAPAMDQRDEQVVSATLKTHPSPQCRLDTFLAGLHQSPRPRCWFFE
jgi:hypothetical protein